MGLDLPPFNGLRLFEAAARCGTFKRAAQEPNLIYGSAAHRKRNSSNGYRSAQIYSASGMEQSLRAIMDIRAQLAFLHFRPQQRPVRFPGFSCAG
jgi:hypothetical protein